MDDDLRSAVTAAYEKDEKAVAPEPPAPAAAASAPSEPTAPPAEPAGAPEAKPEPPPASKPAEPAKPIEPPTTKPDGEEQETKQHRVDRPPQAWSVEARVGWSDLPLGVRQEIHRREIDMDKLRKDTASMRKDFDQLNEVVSPFAGRFQTLGVTPIEAIGRVLRSDYVLATAPKAQRAQLAAQLIQDYEIDIELLDKALSGLVGGGSPAPQKQDVQAIVAQQLQLALQPLFAQQQQADAQIQQQADLTVEQMGLDPKYPHFEDVRMDMADLMELAASRGRPMTLEEAYAKAVSLSPFAAQQQAQDAHQRALKAQAASSSVGGAPAASGQQKFVGDGTLRGDIEAAFANANG